VWYGICKREGSKIKNCVNNTIPLPLSPNGVEELKIWCSHLLPENYKQGDNVNTCCDDEQVHELVANYELAVGILGRCPSCTHNLAHHICDFICSPRHAEFITVKKKKLNAKNRKLFKIFKKHS
jgi:hypothetical protein